MEILGGIISVHILAITLYLIIKRYTASFVLLFMGMMMFVISTFLYPSSESENVFVSVFNEFISIFQDRISGIGLLIMLIGGYVYYMRRIQASSALVYIAMQPLSIAKKYPYVCAIIVIVIGQILYLGLSSATGFALLLIASIYPLLRGIGLSKLTALSAISLCTIFDIGITSSNTLLAVELLGTDYASYFDSQVKLVLPLMLILIPLFYITNKYYDKKEKAKVEPITTEISELNSTPLYYALFPLLPLAITFLLYNFSFDQSYSNLTQSSSAIFISFCLVSIIDMLKKRSLRESLNSMSAFYRGMSRTFLSVIVLIVSADLFSQGLVNLKFVDFLMNSASHLGLDNKLAIAPLYFSSIVSTLITGSGVATFSSLADIIPDISIRINEPSIYLMLPIQLVCGMMRVASPIAIIVISISEFAGVPPTDVVKRNIIPILILSLFLLILTFTIL